MRKDTYFFGHSLWYYMVYYYSKPQVSFCFQLLSLLTFRISDLLSMCCDVGRSDRSDRKIEKQVFL